MSNNHEVVRAIEETQHDFEARVLEIIRRLELGREEALAELRGSREDLRNEVVVLADEIRNRADEVQDDLEEVQKRLGELNFVLAEEHGLHDVATFDELRERIDGAVQAAVADLRSIARASGARSDPGGPMERGWHRFLQAIEVARLHLQEAASAGEGEMTRERRQLIEDLREQAGKEGDQSWIEERYGQAKSALRAFVRVHKAFFQHPDEAVPNHGDQPKKLF